MELDGEVTQQAVFQPYYEGGFPYGKDQFISSSAQRLGGGGFGARVRPRLAATR